MGRYIRWQAILTLTGIAMTMGFLSLLAFSRQTVTLPDVGGVYTEGVVGTPQFINPLLAQYNQVDEDLSSLIFNGLTRIDGEGNLEPDLAKSWTVSDDGQTYLFRLRTDVRWQDGQPFTADDVLFTVGLLQDPEFPGLPSLNQLWQTVTVEKLDEATVQFTLPEPFPAFAESTRVGMLPAHVLGAIPARDLLNHPFNLQPVGTGPFKLEEVNAQYARLSSNPFYAGKKSHLAEIHLRFYPTYQAVISAYKAGETQGISRIPAHALAQVQNIDSLNLYTARLSGYNIIYLNLQTPETSPFFQDVEVRQALLYALDRQTIIDSALEGQGLIANGPILSWSWAYNPEQLTFNFEPDVATSLLDESGWVDQDGDGIREKDGVTLEFSLLTSDDPTKIRIARAVRDQWQQVGVSATVEVVPDNLDERLAQHNFQAALAEVLLVGDPDPYPFWHQAQIDGGQNYSGWNNTEASVLLEAARTVQDQGQRNELYFQFQQIFTDEVPSLILFHPTYTYGVNREIHGVQLAPLSQPSDRLRTVTSWYTLTREVIYRESQFQER